MEYTFFFDEIFHDRKIKYNKSGVMNNMVDNALDCYIGVFLGFENEQINNIAKELECFEVKYKNKFGLSKNQELKSQMMPTKNYIFGIESFKPLTYDFYYDLFTLLNDIKPVLQINMISKTELVIKDLVNNMIFDRRYNVNLTSLIYSLTKFVNVYHTPELLSAFFCKQDEKGNYNYNLRKVLLNHLQVVMSEIKEIPRKRREYPALKQLYLLFRSSKVTGSSKSSYDFPYSSNFVGLSNLLRELNISLSDVSLILDNENCTFQAAKDFDFKSVKQVDSKEHVQVRCVDWICGFIGRIIYSIQKDKSMLDDVLDNIEDVRKIDLSPRRKLSNDWFNISERTYKLYVLIYNSIIRDNEHYWTAMTSINSDQAVMFFSLLRYFAFYESFEQFQTITPEQHTEKYNSSAIAELEEYYRSMVDW